MSDLCEVSDDLKKQISFVSHEIRNNISICEMYSQILKKKLELVNNCDSSIENAINCIRESVMLINSNLADLKAIGSKEVSICDFSKIVINGVNLSKAYIGGKNIDFVVDIPCGINILADENRFLSCVINIMKNAIESIENDGAISVSLCVADNNAVLRIANNGQPIPDEIRNKIFDYGYTTKQTGSGFGLCLTKQYLENQNAQLKLVKSDKAETVFEISIPVAN